MNKKKITTAAVAVAAAAALMLGGTFAWQSISQTALNEASDVINPGGRLHDDFNGENKDVYVENFADDPIYARIRLSEYFEIIANYGKEDIESSTTLLGSKTTDNETGETIYTYELFNNYSSLADGRVAAGVKADATYDADAEEGTDGYAWWTWQTGGETVYMPTFNMNKDSLAADINGEYKYEEGMITAKDIEGGQYTEMVTYEENEELPGTEIYDADANAIEDENVTEVGATHTAKYTENATLISMDEWTNDYNSEAGPYWVYDTDGWVYWAQAIEPDTATGLLLDGIELNQVMDDTWYYAINVEAQFVTADDVGKTDGTGFYVPGTEPTAAAEELLKTIGVDVSGEAGGDSSDDNDTITATETLPAIDFSSGIVPEVTVYRGTNYSFGTVTTDGWFEIYPHTAEITSDNSDHTSYVGTDEYNNIVIAIDTKEPNDTLILNVTYSGDGSESYTNAVTLNVIDPAMPTDAEALQDAFNKGGMINIGETISTDTEDDKEIQDFGGATADYVWTEGGTVNGGALVSTSGSSHTLFINNENNWPVNGDGANAATMNGTNITSGSRFAIYAQAVDAPITLNDMNITNNHGGGILAEYTKPITLNNLTVYSASLDEDYAWVNSALAAGMGANVEISGGSYTGKNAVLILSSGANVTIRSGTFNGSVGFASDISEDGKANSSLTIYGGTFNHNPSEFVAEGYEAVDNGDNTWTVQEKGSSDESEKPLRTFDFYMTYTPEPVHQTYQDGDTVYLYGNAVNNWYTIKLKDGASAEWSFVPVTGLGEAMTDDYETYMEFYDCNSTGTGKIKATVDGYVYELNIVVYSNYLKINDFATNSQANFVYAGAEHDLSLDAAVAYKLTSTGHAAGTYINGSKLFVDENETVTPEITVTTTYGEVVFNEADFYLLDKDNKWIVIADGYTKIDHNASWENGLYGEDVLSAYYEGRKGYVKLNEEGAYTEEVTGPAQDDWNDVEFVLYANTKQDGTGENKVFNLTVPMPY